MNHSARFSAHFARRQRIGAPVCPSSNDLSAAAAGDGPNTRRRQIIDHLTDCPECSELWQLAAAVHGTLGDAISTQLNSQQAPAANDHIDEQGALHHGILQHGKWAAAAALTLTLGLTLLSGSDLNRPLGGEPVYRSATTKPTSRSTSSAMRQAPVLRAQVPAVLDRASFRLRWQAPAGLAVDIRLFDDSLNLLFTGYEVTDRSLLVPAAIFTELAPGATLYWQLEGAGAGATASVDGSVELR